MNHRAQYLPPHWQEWVAKHPKLSKGSLTPEFNRRVHIQFEDGSYAFFNYAFVVEDEDHEEICVFTEHCGYYCFSLKGVEDYQVMENIPYTLTEKVGNEH